MHQLKSLLLRTTLLLPAALAAPWQGHQQSAKKAIYLQSNAVDGNNVVALPIGDDGKLGKGSVYSTSGKGGNHVDANGTAVFPDALLSQSAVAVAGKYLFATNANSNSASMFTVNPSDATDLHLQSISYINDGQFPTTIAASLKHKLVCVATTGKANGVSCANFDAHGMSTFDKIRPLGLVQTTPPAGPPNTVSQVSFTADEKFLIVTVKADPTTNKPGFVNVYAVEGRQLSCEPVRSEPAGTAVLFGFTQVPQTNDFIVTDPSVGAAVLAFDPQTSDVTTLKTINITNQVAICWSTISPATGTAFVADVGVDRLVEISVPEGDIVSITDLSANGDPGLLDMVSIGDFLYALAPGNGTNMPFVTVMNVKSKKMVQHYGLGSFGVTANAQGLAYMA